MFSLTYEENFWDHHQELWTQLSPVFSGIEWCLSTEALDLKHYKTLIQNAIIRNQTMTFHIPHHLQKEHFNIASGDMDKTNSYKHYIAYLDKIQNIAWEAKHMRIVLHPYATDYANRETSIDNTINRHIALQNHLSVRPNIQILLETVPSIGWDMTLYQKFVHHVGIKSPSLCLDTAHLSVLEGLDQWHWLKSHGAYCHVHSSQNPHGGFVTLTPEEAQLLRDINESGLMINIELLARSCDDYLLELQQTQGFLVALLRATKL